MRAEVDRGDKDDPAEEPEDESADMGKVVHVGKETHGEREDRDDKELCKVNPRPIEHLPLLEQIHPQAGDQAKQGARTPEGR